jgi:hypothetical protein
MKTIDEIHRENLRELIKQHGGNTAFAELIGKDTGQLSQWVNGSPDSKTGKPRGISPEICRLFEEKSNCEIGWMDHEHPRPEMKDEEKLLQAFRAMTSEEKQVILRLIVRHTEIDHSKIKSISAASNGGNLAKAKKK